ncbi:MULTISPECIES: NlpC/P60 family protein [Pseudonocardia]|uniref:Peptidoglycan endopeptidase RipA n=2 Tax=Pseudonocardia TaxID=1847 RepID=A0A1Y2MVN2_PSEAH|nr:MULTISPECIES: NlpC/P60 family protein [Pseudonocardia]OSY39039.1 Peptidoglycan endopeptidase RipA precursor [Pseudonocardia autotrophica]TDN71364.1 NlpC/P60 family protein [Pseudonocardia autotrophica]BBG02040.1 hydrolase [Pseudonocardia autotrophica]GEC23203.1 hydrolase [Pseudonocardia saturnea]
MTREPSVLRPARGHRRRMPLAAGVLGLLTALLVATPAVGAAAVAPAPGVLPAAGLSPAQPPPPPPNPDDDELERSRQSVQDRSAEVGRLTARLAELDAQLDELQIEVAARGQEALEARDTADAAGREADAAAARALEARAATEEAGRAVDHARTRLDEFVGDVYTHGLDLGPLGLLSRATDPQDLMDRARLTDSLSEDQASVLEQLQQARIAQANADSLARAAQEEADRRRVVAEEASTAADQALSSAAAAADEQQGRLDAVRSERAEVQARLDDAANSDAGLRAQRQRYLDWQAEQERLRAEADRRAREEASARLAQQESRSRAAPGPAPSAGPAPGPRTGSAAIETVIDRATSRIGTIYAWGGGNSRGPTRGIRDGGVADSHGDFRKVGFDCSGLMLYAFAGVGINLPRYSGNQANAGRLVPISEMRRGDMLSWARNGRTHHIAIYLGDGKMVEAPYSGASVRISPVRYNGLNKVTRLL